MPADTESPVKDTQQVASAAKGAKSAYDTGKAIKTTAQVASAAAKGGTGPVGWVMLAKQLAPTIKKLQQKMRKAIAGAVALGLYLLYLLALKIAGLLAGLAFGAITGLPLLAVPVVGPFLYAGWVGYWGIRGFMKPVETIHLATHPWEPITNAWNYVKGGFQQAGGGVSSGISGAGSAVGGGIASAFGAVGSFFTGLAAATWNGIVGAGGTIAGAVAGTGGAIWGALGSLSIPTSVTTIPIAAGLGSVVVGGTIVGITTATSFFDPSREIPQEIPVLVGDNDAFTITKTVTPTALDNDALSSTVEITFTITLEAKSSRLLNITITDNLTVTSGSGTITINNDSDGNSISPPCGGVPGSTLAANTTWTCQFKIQTRPNWQDSLVNNAVTVTATPEGALEPVLDNADAALPIGNAPVAAQGCPHGWPTTGVITQGPEVGSHLTPLPHGNEAIDIGTSVGTPVYATVTGTILYTAGGGVNQETAIIPAQPCVNPAGGILGRIFYFHMSSINVSTGDQVNWGDRIGNSGNAGSGPHLHYQFNDSNTPRVFKIEVPYIPQALSRRDCSSSGFDCGVIITSAP